MEREHTRPLAGKKIGIFGKGGSGKTTISVLLAKALRVRGYEVVLLDADSTNTGLAVVLGLEGSPRSLIDYFGGTVFSGGLVTCPVDDPTRLPDADLTLADIPSDIVATTPDGIHLLVAGKIGELGPGAGCDGPISKIARDVTVHGNGEDPVTLVDFKAGFEDTARGAITALDWAVVAVDPTLAGVQMAIELGETIKSIRNGALPATRHLDNEMLVHLACEIYTNARIEGLMGVLSRVADDDTETYLRIRLAGLVELVGVIHNHQGISAAWLRGLPFEAPEAESEASGVVDAMSVIATHGLRETA